VQKLAAETGTAIVWVTHDLAVVSGLADRIAVMYAGRIVEEGPTVEVLNAPRHPYTRGLLSSLPARNPRGKPLNQIPGAAPSLLALPLGCAFAPRCARALDICRQVAPAETDAGHERRLRCHNPLAAADVAA
jgi:peptide/nickel transport system ATP-binding protein